MRVQKYDAHARYVTLFYSLSRDIDYTVKLLWCLTNVGSDIITGSNRGATVFFGRHQLNARGRQWRNFHRKRVGVGAESFQ